jgi:hypothetical protein
LRTIGFDDTNPTLRSKPAPVDHRPGFFVFFFSTILQEQRHATW